MLISIRQFEMNVWGLLEVTRKFLLTDCIEHYVIKFPHHRLGAVAPHMIARRSGRIINMGSLAGELPLPFTLAYSASKVCVKFINDGLRSELRPFGIEVTLVKFGAVGVRWPVLAQL